tara:strand:+ start:70 stop:342 length:273 start_codon:yes stop_codon:yes gene_type:complete
MEKVENKITESQLKTIQNHQAEIQDLIGKIGYTEAQKHGMLHELAACNNKVEDFKVELEKEYGAINVNLEDGTYTYIEEEEKEKNLTKNE